MGPLNNQNIAPIKCWHEQIKNIHFDRELNGPNKGTEGENEDKIGAKDA